MVTRKQGFRGECEAKEEEKQGSTWRWVSVGEWGDPGEIHRSRGVRCSGGLEEVGRGKENKGRRAWG